MYSYSLTKLSLKVTKADGTKKEYLFNVCDLNNPKRGEQTRTIAPAENYSDFTFERGYYDASEFLEYGDTGGYEQYNNQFIHFFSFDHTYGEIVEIEFYKEFGINSITLSQELKDVSDRVWACISFDNPATPSVLNVQRDPFPTLNTTFYNTEDPEEIKMIKLRTGEKAALIYMLGSIFERYEYSPVISDTSCDLLLNFDIETELGTHNFIISIYYDYVEYGNESLYIDVVETVNGVHQYSGIDVTYDNIQDDEPVWDYTRVYCISEDKYLGLAASPTWYGLHETTDSTSYFATTMNNRVQELLALAEDVEKIDMSFLNEYETYKSSVLALIQALNA